MYSQICLHVTNLEAVCGYHCIFHNKFELKIGLATVEDKALIVSSLMS